MVKKKSLMTAGDYKKDLPPNRYEILNYCKQLKTPRDKALLAFIYLTGCRIEEVVKYKTKGTIMGRPIKKEQVSIRDSVIEVHNVRVLKRRGRAYKTIPIIRNDIEKPFINILLDYLKTLSDDDYLFNMTRERAWQILNEIDIFPHLLRHCRATHLITDYDFSTIQLQRFIGWKKLDSASDYLHLSTKDLIKKMEERK